MKKIDLWITLAALTGILNLQAQSDCSVEMGAGNAGTLYERITNPEEVRNLAVTGEIDARDFARVRDNMPDLVSLDLKETVIVAYTGTEGTHYYDPGDPESGRPAEEITGITYDAGTMPEYALGYISEIVLPTSLTGLHTYAFSNSSTLTRLDFSACNGLTEIPYSLFWYQGNLAEIRLPASINAIGAYAFGYATGLTDLYVYAETPPEATEASFLECPVADQVTLHVPKNSIEAYQAQAPWNTFFKIREADSLITGLPEITTEPLVYTQNGHLRIRTVENRTVNVWNLNGQLVKQLFVSPGETDIVLPQGVYLIDGKKIML